MRILISGASIAGPVLAYWLTRYGFEVTVVERAPTLRKTGGHAVDLFRPAMEISAKMGVLPRIEDLATGTTRLTLYREGRPQPSRIDLTKIYAASSDRHVEIMRDDLSEVYYDAARDDVEYLFGDSITAIEPDGTVTFEHCAPSTFDVVVGADGLHSNVRRLTFGDEAGLTRFLGGYLSVVSAPKTLVGPGEMVGHVGVGRFAGIYTADHLDDARAVFLFRSAAELAYDHRDTARQKELLREAFAGMHDEVDGWLAETERTPTFYFDSITQLRTDRWSRRRVTLVGDAGYCPGPAVGGSTSLAVLGAYVLAGELARGRRRPPARLRRLRTADARIGAAQPILCPRRRPRRHSRFPRRGVGVNPWRPTGLGDADVVGPGAGQAQHQGRPDARFDAGARLRRQRRLTTWCATKGDRSWN